LSLLVFGFGHIELQTDQFGYLVADGIDGAVKLAVKIIEAAGDDAVLGCEKLLQSGDVAIRRAEQGARLCRQFLLGWGQLGGLITLPLLLDLLLGPLDLLQRLFGADEARIGLVDVVDDGDGVVVGDGSDVGGGASIMGTLSGGGKEVISVGKKCLLGANSGLGISLGDNCVVEAGTYITAAAKVRLPDGIIAKAATLSGASNLLFRRNSLDGSLEVVMREGSWGGLNSILHSN
jgi:hypothetical protein